MGVQGANLRPLGLKQIHNRPVHQPEGASDRPLFVTTFAARIPAGQGAARPILCLHGLEAHGLRFFGLARRLPQAMIVAPDLRGHGQSPKEGPWTLEQHVRDLLPLLESLGRETVLLGHSYGGLIAWEMARSAPDRMAALVLVDPAIHIGPELAQEVRESAASDLRWPSEAAALHDLLAGREPAAHWSVALDVAVATEHITDGRLRPVVAEEAILACLEQVTATIRSTDYRGPTLLVEAGRENGRYVSQELLDEMRRQLGEQLEHVSIDAPHTIPADGADLLATAVERFVSALGV
jgi:lipase